MTSFRNPIDGAFIPFSLACVDLDPVSGLRTGSTCQRRQAEHPKDQKRPYFKCPNRKNGAAGHCDSTTFLYPRRWGKGTEFHVHQGIDIFSRRGAPIKSVTAGRVFAASNELLAGYSGYGRVVVIESIGPGRVLHYFLYAHCERVLVHENDSVSEQQIIATVGTTCFTTGSPNATFDDREAHLHLEVSTKKYPLANSDRRAAGDPVPAKGRLDPRAVLERLGPWGMTEVYLPGDRKLTRALATVAHEDIEASASGGCFPLGANNHWHGGVHLPALRGSTLVAPFDATIVAARLDPDPAHAMQAGGHCNFILLRHEVPESCYALFQGKGPRAIAIEPPRPTEPEDRAVGTKSRCANQLADVTRVKQQLHAHHDAHGQPYYDPDDPAELTTDTVTSALASAITAFQTDVVVDIHPDGVVDIPGKTWTALHDGTPPVEPTPEPTDGPPPRPLDPQRVLYSLLMHLEPITIDDELARTFSWLTRVQLALMPGELDPTQVEAERAQQEREQDLAEAEHTLMGAVGAATADGIPATNDPDDVHWVHQRLIRFGYHPGPPSITCDERLIAAIRELQNDHHPAFESSNDGDGRIDPSGGTLVLLQTTHAELLGSRRTSALDPVFLQRTTVRDEHGVARVITGLDVKVRSGEPLWRSGQSLGYAPDGESTVMFDQIHWELFSEHLLVGGWEDPLEDDTDDLTADVPARLVEVIEDGAPELAQDGLLRVDEIHSFYASGRGEFLRRTPCRFVSHWGLDVAKAVARLDAMGFDVTGLPELLRPFMWWDQATDVLPAKRLVWHYNPIELMAQYAEHLEALRPELRDPKTHPTLVVRVLYDNGIPMPNVAVELLHGLSVERTVTTSKDGEARFSGVAVGEYGVRVVEPATAPMPIEMRPNETNELEIVTDIPGPPPPRGTIQVIVRRHTFTIAGDDVEVWLSPVGAGDIVQDLTNNGKVRFEGLVHGDYTIEAGDAEAVAVTLDRKTKSVTVILPPARGSLRMEVLVGEAPAAHQAIDVLAGDDVVVSAVTDAHGMARLELPEGRYGARVGQTLERVRVEGNVETHYVMQLDEKDAPEPEPQGTLAVSVSRSDDGEPALTELVFVSDGRDGVSDAGYPDASGVASFALPPGDYMIDVAELSVGATVGAMATTWVALEVAG